MVDAEDGKSLGCDAVDIVGIGDREGTAFRVILLCDVKRPVASGYVRISIVLEGDEESMSKLRTRHKAQLTGLPLAS